MKKIVSIVAMAFVAASLFAAPKIKIGIVNNPPSESGYRAANVKDFETVFNKKKGYKVSTFYSGKLEEQLNAVSQFITDGVDYILISAAETEGWDSVLKEAKANGIKVFLFDRMINASDSLYECAVRAVAAFFALRKCKDGYSA